MRLILLRHASTAWNRQGRIQGLSNQPLSAEGRADAATWRLPPDFRPTVWISSPLRRARETTACMGVTATVDDRLREMDWGEWEGRSLQNLRTELGAAFSENESRGLDFLPPGGESPRMVQARLLPWIDTVTGQRRNTGVITHKGVIRALLGLATGWDFLGTPPAPMGQGEAQSIVIDDRGGLRLERPRIPLTGSPS